MLRSYKFSRRRLCQACGWPPFLYPETPRTNLEVSPSLEAAVSGWHNWCDCLLWIGAKSKHLACRYNVSSCDTVASECDGMRPNLMALHHKNILGSR